MVIKPQFTITNEDVAAHIRAAAETTPEVTLPLPAKGWGAVGIVVEIEPQDGARRFARVGMLYYQDGNLVSRKAHNEAVDAQIMEMARAQGKNLLDVHNEIRAGRGRERTEPFTAPELEQAFEAQPRHFYCEHGDTLRFDDGALITFEDGQVKTCHDTEYAYWTDPLDPKGYEAAGMYESLEDAADLRREWEAGRLGLTRWVPVTEKSPDMPYTIPNWDKSETMPVMCEGKAKSAFALRHIDGGKISWMDANHSGRVLNGVTHYLPLENLTTPRPETK